MIESGAHHPIFDEEKRKLALESARLGEDLIFFNFLY